jgi:hypothetical protein
MEEKFKTVRKEQALIHRERTRRELQIKKTNRDLVEQVSKSSMSMKHKTNPVSLLFDYSDLPILPYKKKWNIWKRKLHKSSTMGFVPNAILNNR